MAEKMFSPTPGGQNVAVTKKFTLVFIIHKDMLEA